MDKEKAIIEVRRKGIIADLEVPLEITANDFIVAMDEVYHLGINRDNLSECYVKTQFPIALIRGSKTLREFGVRNGTVFNFDF